MIKIICALTVLISANAFAQEETPTEQAQPIIAEGKKLYRLEMSSWYGTDIFLENYKDHEKIKGYFSYPDGDTTKCIFYSTAVQPKVIGTISFDNTFNIETAKLDMQERSFTKYETEILTIREIAMEAVEKDTIFKFYKNTNLNPIPVINDNEKKVYFLTGTSSKSVVLFGNDYLITFDKDNKITSTRSLHRNLIPIEYTKNGKDAESNEVVGAAHIHLPGTGDFITATDICTLMLYSKFAGWKQHTVISEKYYNLWNCIDNALTVIPRDDVKK